MVFPERIGRKVRVMRGAARDKFVVFKLDDDIGTWLRRKDMETPSLNEEEVDLASRRGKTAPWRGRLLDVEHWWMERELCGWLSVQRSVQRRCC